MAALFGPAKAILFGEHAVVHGHPALAAALSIGVKVVRVSPLPAGGQTRVKISPWETCNTAGDGTRMGESLGRILAAVEAACGPIAPVEIEMSADVPVGAGLGSSAALAVATARALLSTKAPREASVDDVTISAAAASEQVYHGNPSGVDHTTSARGGILVYQKGGRPLFRPLAASSLPLVIAQMAPGADTAEMVAAVERRRCAEPEAIGAVLAMLGRLTGLAEGALERADFSRVGRLMDIAHGGLVSLGVSTACLDRGCHAARRAGAWGAKLTGAGGGGCLIAIVDEQRREAVISALESAGAMVCFSTDAGFSGA